MIWTCRRVFVCALLGAVAGCSRADIPAPAMSSQLQVDSIPFFDYATTRPDGQAAIGLATAGFRLGSGIIVLSDSIDVGLRLLDPATSALRRVGGRGAGPAEFRDIGWMHQCGRDSIFVWDRMLQRMSVFDSAGHFVRELKFHVPPWRAACSPLSSTLAVIPVPEVNFIAADAPSKTVFTRVVFTDFDGDSTGAIARVPAGETRSVMPHLSVAAMDGSIFYFGSSDSMLVARYTMSGAPRQPLVLGGTVRVPTDAEYQREMDMLLKFFPDTTMRRQMAQRIGQLPKPALMPAYSQLFVDPAGRIWAETSRPGETATSFRVVASSGRQLGTVTVPFALRVFDIGRDYLLGAVDDRDGDQHVVMYRYHGAP